MTSLLYHSPFFYLITDEGIPLPYRSGCLTFLVDRLGSGLVSTLSRSVLSASYVSLSSSSST